jgi:leucyl aminopeptidase
MFNITFGFKGNDTTYEKSSINIEFFKNDENLSKNIEDYIIKNNIKINAVLHKKLIEEKDFNEIKVQGFDDNPYLTIIKKIKIDKKFNNDFFRNYIAGVIKGIVNEPVKVLYIQVPEYQEYKNYFEEELGYYQSFVEGVLLGNYAFDKYKSDKKPTKNLKVYLVSDKKEIINEAIKSGENIMNGVYLTRDLTNEIPDVLTPQTLSESAKELTKLGIKVKVFNIEQLKQMGMNGIISVGKASTNKPLMMVLEYKPKTKAKVKIALVGKGVTYDAGGLSLKTTEGMVEMKADMAGAGVVMGVFKAAALEKLPIHLIGIIPAVENVISGNAYKPGDIIKTASGKTIEVGNTDAEGRIILSDALYYACKQKPNYLIDFATLTGACVVALGEFTAGLFTNSDELANNLLSAAKSVGERLWQLPMWDEYNTLIESKLADVKNVGGKWGGAITAAKFLEHFVDENINWAHLDIAGPSIAYKLNNYSDGYNTGYGVRLTVKYLKDLCNR